MKNSTSIMLPLSLIFFSMGWTLDSIAASTMDVMTIMKKNEASRKIGEYFSTATLTVTRNGESPKTKKFKMWRKMKADHVHFQSVTQFLEPSEVKGQAILFQENDSGLNDISLYLPAYKKVRRVESNQQSGSFMGSDFSYSDLTQQHVEDYDFKLLGEESFEGIKCYKVKASPKTDELRARTGYQYSQVLIDQKTFSTLYSEFFDSEGKKIKTLTARKTEKLGTDGVLYFSRDLTVNGIRDQSSTRLVFEPLQLKVNVEDSFFTVQNFSKLK